MPYCDNVCSWVNRVSPDDGRGDEGLVHQPTHDVEDIGARDLVVGADGLDRFELAAADEYRQPSEQASLVFEEEVVAPVDDGTQGLLAGQRGAGTAGEQREPVVEPFGQRGQGEGSEAGGGKLDGERQAVESTADAVDDAFGRAVSFEAGLYRTSTIDEELGGDRGCQPGYGNEDLAGNAERLAAGGDQPEAGHLPDQGVGEGSRLIDDVFAVVEDDHERAAGEVAGDELSRRLRGLGVAQRRPRDSERRGRGRCDSCGIGDVGELDQPGSAGVLFAHAGPPPRAPAGSCPLLLGRQA